MKKIQFIAEYPHHPHIDSSCHATEDYVMHLLLNDLMAYGFNVALDEKENNIVVNVEGNQVGLSVTCDQHDSSEKLCCCLHLYMHEEPAWFKKIETQSLVKQLAHALENILKNDAAMSHLEWIE